MKRISKERTRKIFRLSLSCAKPRKELFKGDRVKMRKTKKVDERGDKKRNQ